MASVNNKDQAAGIRKARRLRFIASRIFSIAVAPRQEEREARKAWASMYDVHAFAFAAVMDLRVY
jgi:hypothetical protein